MAPSQHSSHSQLSHISATQSQSTQPPSQRHHHSHPQSPVPAPVCTTPSHSASDLDDVIEPTPTPRIRCTLPLDESVSPTQQPFSYHDTDQTASPTQPLSSAAQCRPTNVGPDDQLFFEDDEGQNAHSAEHDDQGERQHSADQEQNLRLFQKAVSSSPSHPIHQESLLTHSPTASNSEQHHVSSVLEKPLSTLPPMVVTTADTLLSGNSSWFTSCNGLNSALGNGLRSRRVTQLSGPPLSGKTMTALSIASTVLHAGGGVLWFETTHSPWEIRTFLEANLVSSNLPIPLPLSVFPVPTLSETLTTLNAVKDDLSLIRLCSIGSQDSNAHCALFRTLLNVKLVVFDSVATILSPLLGLRLSQSWTGHVAEDQLASLLRWFATDANTAVVITNRLVGSHSIPHPALGNRWSTLVDVNLNYFVDNVPSVHERFDATDSTPSPIIAIETKSKFAREDPSRSHRFVLTHRGICDIPNT